MPTPGHGKIPCTWEKAQRHPIKSKKGRTPHKLTSMQTEDDAFETDIPTGHRFGYLPQIFINHMQLTTSSKEMTEERKFLGRYSEFCNKCNETHCWCSSYNWEEGLTDVNGTRSNPSIERNPSPTVEENPL